MPGIQITLVYSPQQRVAVERQLAVEEGSTVAQVLAMAGLPALVMSHAAEAGGLGVWGKRVKPTHPLKDTDRVEIYRPLTVDPKVARRERFVGQGAKKAAGLFAKRRTGAKAGY